MLVAGSYVVPSERPSSESELPATSYQLPAISIQLASYDRSKPVVIDPMIIYSTYLGGSDQEVTGRPDGDFKVDGAGNAYVTGFTQSTNFPASPGAFQTTFGGGQFDVFVTKLNPVALRSSTQPIWEEAASTRFTAWLWIPVGMPM